MTHVLSTGVNKGGREKDKWILNNILSLIRSFSHKTRAEEKKRNEYLA
jgi:hypothetical protein